MRVGMYIDKGYCSCAGKCCMECTSLATCENSCTKCEERKAVVAAARNSQIEKQRENSERLAAERKEKQAASDQRASKLWQRLGAAREAVGMSAEALYSDILQLADEEDLEEFCGYEKGKIAANWFDEPFPEDGDLLRLTAAALHCTTDYLLGISDEPTPAAEAVPTWRTGVPETSGLYAAKFECSGHIMKKLVYYDNCLKKFYFDESHGRSIEAACVGWYPVPQDEEAE